MARWQDGKMVIAVLPFCPSRYKPGIKLVSIRKGVYHEIS